MLGPFQIAIYRVEHSAASLPFAATTPRASFAVTFEKVYSALEACPRMFIEPDGSFVWVGEEPNATGSATAWQLDGHLYDRNERLLYVELQGTCPPATFEMMLAMCGVSLEETLIEHRRAGSITSGKEFVLNHSDPRQ